MSKIILNAYFDLNFGDDYMIEKIINEFPNSTFIVKGVPEEFQKPFINSNIVFVSKIQYIYHLFTCDSILYLGGSIYQIKTESVFQSFKKRKKMLRFIRRMRKKIPIITLGSNLGPFEILGSEELIREVISENTHVFVRDDASFEKVNLIQNINSYRISDLLSTNNQCSIVYKHQKSDILGISIYHGDETYIESMVHLVNSFSKYFSKINLISFNSGEEDDTKYADRIIDKVDSSVNNVSMISYTGNIGDFESEFQKTDLLIAVRFHSAIFAMNNNIPFVPISYSNKMTDYFKIETENIISLEKFSNKSVDMLLSKLIGTEGYLCEYNLSLTSPNSLSQDKVYNLLHEVIEK